MKRTGSRGSCVGPAVMRTVSPSRSVPLLTRGATGFSTPSTASAMRSGSTSQQAFLWLNDKVAALFQDCQIFPRGWMRPHVVVHGRRKNNGAGKGQVGGGQEIVRVTVRQAGQQIGGSRCDHQYVIVLRYGD